MPRSCVRDLLTPSTRFPPFSGGPGAPGPQTATSISSTPNQHPPYETPHRTPHPTNRITDHAHHVLGIITHTHTHTHTPTTGRTTSSNNNNTTNPDNRAVVSVALRSLAVVSAALTDRREQAEVLDVLGRIARETGWRVGRVGEELRRGWGWDSSSSSSSHLAPALGGGVGSSHGGLGGGLGVGVGTVGFGVGVGVGGGTGGLVALHHLGSGGVRGGREGGDGRGRGVSDWG